MVNAYLITLEIYLQNNFGKMIQSCTFEFKDTWQVLPFGSSYQILQLDVKFSDMMYCMGLMLFKNLLQY